jgi:hypothetical protein
MRGAGTHPFLLLSEEVGSGDQRCGDDERRCLAMHLCDAQYREKHGTWAEGRTIQVLMAFNAIGDR